MSKMGPKQLQLFIMLSNKEILSSKKLEIFFANFSGYKDHGCHKFLTPKPRAVFKRRKLVRTMCFHGANDYRVRTTSHTPNELERERTTLVPMVRTGCLSKLVRTMETQWMRKQFTLYPEYYLNTLCLFETEWLARTLKWRAWLPFSVQNKSTRDHISCG